MPKYVVEVKAKDGEGSVPGEPASTCWSLTRRARWPRGGIVERDGYQFIRLRVVGDPRKRDKRESWIGLGGGILLTLILLAFAALILFYL